MYTTNSQKQGTSALQVFEEVRSFFLQKSSARSAPETPVRIIAFNSEREFKPYRFNEGAFAYYTRSRKVDYIVMQDIDSAHYRSAVHEYTHLIEEHLKLKLPIWFNEGLADLYSTIEAEGKKTIVGKPIADHVMILRTQQWLDLNTLFQVDHDSPYYNQREKMQLFYAESWALTHMLTLGKDYQANFAKFLAAVAERRSVADCLKTTYGKNVGQVQQDLQSYLRQFTVQVSVFDSKLEKPELDPEVGPVSDLNLNLVLADLLACQQKRLPEGMERLTKLASDYPAVADVDESLGYLYWQQSDQAKARDHFQAAVEKGSKSAGMYYDYSQLLLMSGGPRQQALDLLLKADTFRPNNRDTLLAIGRLALDMERWNEALRAFSAVKSVTPDRAYALFSGLAYANWKLKAPDPARQYADKARQYARNPDEIERISRLQEIMRRPANAEPLHSLGVASANNVSPVSEEPEHPPSLRHQPKRDEPTLRLPNLQHVEAVVESFTCDPKTPSLRVKVESKEMTFIIMNPEAVVVRNSPNGQIDFTCGPQKATNVGIFYTPSPPGSKADGSISELVF